MALTLATTAPGKSSDYIKYLFEYPTKTNRLNEPKLLDFSLVPIDGSFVRLSRGNYITFTTNTYSKWFTGFVTNDPEPSYIGTDKNHNPVWGYKYEATDDSFILNISPVGVMPPFINTTQGAIIKALADKLAPGFFTTTNVQDGMSVARYVVDPQKHFSEIVREFCDSASYNFFAHDKALTYRAVTDVAGAINIDGNSKHFTPSRLKLQPSNDQVINDAIVLGTVEPQGYIHEYFVGDGLTARFPLLSSAFGVDSTVLLDEQFQDSTIDTEKWSLFDTVNQWIQVSNGYLNVLGGANDNSYGSYLQSSKLIPLEGQVRLTHGEWDFVSASSGVVAGLWTNAPASTYSGCIYGIECSKNSTNTVLKPIVNGVVDGTKTLTINYAHRYVMRTVMSVSDYIRLDPVYSALKADGTIKQYGGSTPTSSNTTFLTTITEIDPSNGSVVATTSWLNSTTVSSVWAYYTPVAANDLHCTVSNITISTPMQVNLAIKAAGTSTWVNQLVGPNDIDVFDGTQTVATVVDSNSGIISKSSTLGTPQYNPSGATLQFFKDTTQQISYVPAVGDLLHVWYRRAGVAAGRVKDTTSISTESALWGDAGIRSIARNDFDPPPRSAEECESLAAALITEFGYQHYDGSYTQYSDYEFTGEPIPGTILDFTNLPSGLPSVQSELITEVSSKMIRKSPTGTELYEHTVSFGRPDRINRLLSNMKKSDERDVIRPIDTALMPDWTDVSVVGSAFVADVVSPFLSSYTTTQFTYDAGQAPPGLSPNLMTYTEDFTQYTLAAAGTGTTPVVTANAGASPDTTTTADRVQLNRGAGNTTSDYSRISRLPVTYVSGETYTVSVWLKSNTGLSQNVSIEIASGVHQLCSVTTSWQRFSKTWTTTGSSSMGLYITTRGTYGSDQAIDVLAWGAQLEKASAATVYVPRLAASLTYDGGFEVRYSDESWGADDAKNLITRVTGGTQTFNVPRTARGRISFLRGFDQRNFLKYSEDLTNAVWNKANTTVSNTMLADPDGNMSLVSNVNFTTGSQTAYINQYALTTSGTRATGGLTKLFASCWVKGTSGKQINLRIITAGGVIVVSTNFTMTGSWQKLSVSATGLSTTTEIRMLILNPEATAYTAYITRCNFECNTLTETVYCKTNSTRYGVMSRYSAGLRVQFPAIPNAPTATVDYTDAANPKITPVMPTVQLDVWGVEIRASNNSTVLWKEDLISQDYQLPVTISGNASRSLSYYVYTYNLLGEYSTGYNLTATIPTPSAASLTVDDTSKAVTWTGSNASGYQLEIATDAGYTTKTVDKTVTDTIFQLADADFFPTRYFRVTPKDALGNGTAQTTSHTYTPAAPSEFNGNEVGVIGPPAGPSTPATPPAGIVDQGAYVGASWENYILNHYLRTT